MSKALNIFLALLVAVFPVLPAYADLPAHWNTGKGASQTAPFILPEYDSSLPNERKLDEDTDGFLKFTDMGPGSLFKLEFDNTALPILRGGTGGATQQAAVDGVLNFSGKATGDLVIYDGTHWVRLPKPGSDGYFLGRSGGVIGYFAPSGSGTVTSVDVTVPSSILAISGGPVTGSGTFVITLQNQTANTVFAGPTTGGAAAPTFRALVAADLPNHSASLITSGNLAKARSATEGVYNDQSNTYSGTATQDIGASGQTLVIPKKSTLATAGEVAVDTDDLKFRSTGGNTRTVVKTTRSVATGTGLTGGGDMSADRTIALDTPVAATNGGTGQTTWTTGDTVYASGTNTLAKRAAGTNGYVYTMVSGVPNWAAPGGSFGGSGGDSAVTKGAVTETTVMQYNATTFTQTVSTIYVSKSGSIYRSTSTQDWNGTTNVATGFSGPAGAASTGNIDGNGPCAGKGAVYSGSSFSPAGGGGGGGNAGAGARGADGSTAGNRGGGTQELYAVGGSSGGAGGATDAAGGTGGNGGGIFYAESIGNLTIGSGGSINATGGAGGASSGGSSNPGGGGGGGGGTIQLLCQGTFTKTGNVTANGGDGGSAAGASGGKGGAGGGGRIVVMAPTITGAGSLIVNAGSNAATGSTTNLGTAGAGVATSITGTPTTRFAMDMRKNWAPLDTFYHLQADAGAIQPGQELKCEAKGVIQMYAAFNARTQKEQAKLAHEYTFGTTLDGVCQAEWVETTCGDEVLKNAA